MGFALEILNWFNILTMNKIIHPLLVLKEEKAYEDIKRYKVKANVRYKL